MTFDNSIWAPDPEAEALREARINLALLRGTMERLRANCRNIPLFALLVAAMFSPWARLPWLGLWYGQVLLATGVQLALIRAFPAGDIAEGPARKWTAAVAAGNLFFIVCWTSLGWYLWAPDSELNHMLIAIVLATTLAAHATLTSASHALARPSFALYGAVMALVSLQDHHPHALYMAAVAPIYVWYVASIAKQHHIRARASQVLTDERDALLAELVMAKIESDRGRERAEAASLAKSQFLANMSHELRTPLNAILGFSEVISSRMLEGAPERTVEYAGLIHSSGHHLLALINDILDLAKIEAGRWKLEEAEIDLRHVADDALQLVQWRAQDSGALLENAIPADLPLVYADERAIKQVMLNLLSNAVKFTPARGQVTTFAHVGEKGGLCFGVADTGVGIRAEDQRRVFDSFGQGKHDVAVAERGTGLGLAIVKGLAESHGGRVRLDSEIGKGTCVTITFPPVRTRPRMPAPHPQLTHHVA